MSGVVRERPIYPPETDGETSPCCGSALDCSYGFCGDAGLGIHNRCTVCGLPYDFTPDPEMWTEPERERWVAHLAAKGAAR